jgi:hypothetical protein
VSMNIRDIVLESVDWIHLVQDKLANTAMNVRVS